MARTAAERFDDTLKYVDEKVSASLALHIKSLIPKAEIDTFGAQLSLSKMGYWNKGTKDQHRAVRALLLCHKTYLTDRWAENQLGNKFNYNLYPTQAQTLFREKSEDGVKKAIQAYVKLDNPPIASIAAAAAQIRPSIPVWAISSPATARWTASPSPASKAFRNTSTSAPRPLCSSRMRCSPARQWIRIG